MAYSYIPGSLMSSYVANTKSPRSVEFVLWKKAARMYNGSRLVSGLSLWSIEAWKVEIFLSSSQLLLNSVASCVMSISVSFALGGDSNLFHTFDINLTVHPTQVCFAHLLVMSTFGIWLVAVLLFEFIFWSWFLLQKSLILMRRHFLQYLIVGFHQT